MTNKHSPSPRRSPRPRGAALELGLHLSHSPECCRGPCVLRFCLFEFRALSLTSDLIVTVFPHFSQQTAAPQLAMARTNALTDEEKRRVVAGYLEGGQASLNVALQHAVDPSKPKPPVQLKEPLTTHQALMVFYVGSKAEKKGEIPAHGARLLCIIDPGAKCEDPNGAITRADEVRVEKRIAKLKKKKKAKKCQRPALLQWMAQLWAGERWDARPSKVGCTNLQASRAYAYASTRTLTAPPSLLSPLSSPLLSLLSLLSPLLSLLSLSSLSPLSPLSSLSPLLSPLSSLSPLQAELKAVHQQNQRLRKRLAQSEAGRQASEDRADEAARGEREAIKRVVRLEMRVVQSRTQQQQEHAKELDDKARAVRAGERSLRAALADVREREKMATHNEGQIAGALSVLKATTKDLLGRTRLYGQNSKLAKQNAVLDEELKTARKKITKERKEKREARKEAAEMEVAIDELHETTAELQKRDKEMEELETVREACKNPKDSRGGYKPVYIILMMCLMACGISMAGGSLVFVFFASALGLGLKRPSATTFGRVRTALHRFTRVLGFGIVAVTQPSLTLVHDAATIQGGRSVNGAGFHIGDMFVPMQLTAAADKGSKQFVKDYKESTSTSRKWFEDFCEFCEGKGLDARELWFDFADGAEVRFDLDAYITKVHAVCSDNANTAKGVTRLLVDWLNGKGLALDKDGKVRVRQMAIVVAIYCHNHKRNKCTEYALKELNKLLKNKDYTGKRITVQNAMRTIFLNIGQTSARGEVSYYYNGRPNEFKQKVREETDKESTENVYLGIKALVGNRFDIHFENALALMFLWDVLEDMVMDDCETAGKLGINVCNIVGSTEIEEAFLALALFFCRVVWPWRLMTNAKKEDEDEDEDEDGEGMDKDEEKEGGEEKKDGGEGGENKNGGEGWGGKPKELLLDGEEYRAGLVEMMKLLERLEKDGSLIVSGERFFKNEKVVAAEKRWKEKERKKTEAMSKRYKEKDDDGRRRVGAFVQALARGFQKQAKKMLKKSLPGKDQYTGDELKVADACRHFSDG
jgi:hypothetical protein